MRIHGLGAIAAAICILSLTACGGGGGGSTVPPPVRSSAADAATAVPVAGSVTQSSDVSQGVTANAIEASVALDERGLLTAEIRGHGWRIRNEPVRYRFSEGRWTGVRYYQMLPDGSLRSASVSTDRARTVERAVASGDVWISSERIDIDELWDALYTGIPGTLNGVEGTLVCAGECDDSTPLSPPGEPAPEPETPGSGSPYSFDAETGFKFIRKTDAQNPPDDRDYLILGFWAHVPQKWLDENGASRKDEGFSAQFYKDIEYGFFVNGSDPFDQENIQPLTGTATYNGDAFALYIDTNINPRTGYGKEVGLEASVTLTAEFGSGSENGTVSGSIRNFQSPGYEPEYPDEPDGLATVPTALTLNNAPISDTHSGFFTGDTAMTFDGSRFAGKWGGQFYGNGEPDGNPGSAAGTFGAATGNGSKAIIGAFGAYKQ